MMRNWNDGWLCGPGTYFHSPFGMLINFAFWVLVIFFLIWAFKALFNKKSTSAPPLSALETLQHRYAAGEIECDEYERMKRELQG